jgi:hypothetical protein
MRHYKSNADACYGAMLVVMALMALWFSAFTIDWDIHALAIIPRQLIYYPLGILFALAFIARWQLFHSRIRWWVYSALILSSGYVICFDSGWFYNELHDLALEYFRSHGRFGCHDANYSSYIFRDTTAPWILFSPLIIATLLHWLYSSPIVKKHAVSLYRWSTTYESRPAA